MWKTHYSQILNCVSNTEHKENVQTIFSSISPNDRHLIMPNHIAAAINDMKGGKSIGNDLLAAEHYKHAHPILL